MTKKWTILGALVISLLLAGTALAQGSIDWWVIGGGGGSGTAGSTSLDGTIGQPVVGVVSNAPYELCSGFWCSGASPGSFLIYLPVTLKNFSP